MRPYALASAGDMKLSRSVSRLIVSTGDTVCLAYSSFMVSRARKISRAWLSMSVAWP